MPSQNTNTRPALNPLQFDVRTTAALKALLTSVHHLQVSGLRLAIPFTPSESFKKPKGRTAATSDFRMLQQDDCFHESLSARATNN